MKLSIGIDLDDVVVEHIPHLVTHYNQEYKDSIPISDISTWQIVNHLPLVNRDEKVFYAMWDHFYGTEKFKSLPEMPGAIQTIKQLASKHKLYFLTARKADLARKTYEWLGNHKLLDVPVFFDTSKGWLAKELGLDIHIDDGLHNLDNIVIHSPSTVPIVFNRPWNINNSTYSRVYDWNDVINAVDEVRAKKLQHVLDNPLNPIGNS